MGCTQEFLSELHQSFELSLSEECEIYNDLLKSFDEALENSEISMISSNFKIPKDIPSKNGYSICIDFGGSTLRIAILKIIEKNAIVEKQKEWILNEDAKLINFTFFNQIISKCIEMTDVYTKEYALDNDCWDVGITWSFPLNSNYEILNLGKGFTLDQEISGFNLKELIIESFQQYDLKLGHVSIINDSIAVNLASLLQTEGDSPNISLIIGTGINACIQLNNELINTELGFFGILPKPNKYDLQLDPRWNHDNFPHLKQTEIDNLFQPLEFLCSSRYISELFRLILLDFVESKIIQIGETPLILNSKYEIHGSLITLLEDITNIKYVQRTLSDKFQLNLSKKDIDILNQIVHMILQRSAKYIALSIKALNQFIGYDNGSQFTVTYVGSFIVHSELYRKKIIKYSGGSVILNHVDNSSIIGAGVAAFLKL